MGMASHLGPWLLGTVKNTTGTAAGSVRNMGATIVAQTKVVNYNDGTGVSAFALPAGAVITAAQFITTTTFDAASTIVVKVGGTAINSATTITTGGPYAISISNTQAVGRLVVVGSSDVLVTYDLSVGASTAGVGTLVIAYVVRNADGTTAPTSSQA
mgnify:CR=1 FL=1